MSLKTALFIAFSFFLIIQDQPGLEIPAYKSTDTIIRHTAYTVSYNTKHLQANWIAYRLDKENLLHKVKRNGSFKKDPDYSNTAQNSDYKGSGYDKGHLFPASDSWTDDIMRESFYLTNISPQNHSFNAGIWKSLETLEKEWGMDCGTVYITTGPVLKTFIGSIGRGVNVPLYFYKVILDYTQPEVKGIGFILKNVAGVESRLSSYAITIDSVEKVTGIDFFPGLPDADELLIESRVDINKWRWR